MSVVVQNISLEPFNTFAVPAQARFYAEVSTPEDIRSVLADHRYGSLPRFVLGGGSNTLFTKDFDGLVLRMTGGLIDLVDENDGFYFVRVGAGVVWDDFVRLALEKNWYGLENLAAIPGTVGGAAVQNIGAYGVEVAERIVEVECFDPDRRAIRVLSAEDCDYGYRTSLFKTEEKNLIVTSVLFALPKVFEPVCSYKELEAHFAGKSPESARELEEAVRAVRARKLPDPKVLPNAGSFFKNPIVTRTKMLALLEETPSLCVIDVSFISLKLILPAVHRVLKEGGHVACLIKPQFEAGREKVGKKGVVRDPDVHLEVLENFLTHAKDSGFTVLDITFSPIRGPEGNIEYLGYLESGDWVEKTFDLQGLVEQSHAALDHGKEGAGC